MPSVVYSSWEAFLRAAARLWGRWVMPSGPSDLLRRPLFLPGTLPLSSPAGIQATPSYRTVAHARHRSLQGKGLLTHIFSPGLRVHRPQGQV